VLIFSEIGSVLFAAVARAFRVVPAKAVGNKQRFAKIFHATPTKIFRRKQ
jgi:hypothetical protein